MEPAQPCLSPGSPVVLIVSGVWPDSGVPTDAAASVLGEEIDIVLEASAGVLPVLMPYSLPAEVGQLNPGVYEVYASAANLGVPLRPRVLAGMIVVQASCAGECYANCDGSTVAPVLNVADFACFLGEFAAGGLYANCDGSTTPPVLNVADFSCFLSKFAAGCP